MPDLDERIAREIAIAKQNCMLCRGRSRLRSVEKERGKVKEALKSLVELFNHRFNSLRREDADAAEIREAIELKRFCMDLLEKCSSCGMENDVVKRNLNRLGKWKQE